MKKNAQIRVTKHSPEHWRVTFDYPPPNIFVPEMLPQVNEIITPPRDMFTVRPRPR